MDVDLTLLGNLVLGDDVQVSERLMQECRDIISLLEDLGIDVVIDKLEQLLEDAFNVFDFFQVGVYQRHLRHELLFLLLISSKVTS